MQYYDDRMLVGQSKTGISFVDGDILQLTVENNKVVFDKSDGSSPIGIYRDYPVNDGRIFCSFVRSIVNTKHYELSQQYPINANLYVSKNGLITSEKQEFNNFVVGMVIESPTLLNDNVLQYLWF